MAHILCRLVSLAVHVGVVFCVFLVPTVGVDGIEFCAGQLPYSKCRLRLGVRDAVCTCSDVLQSEAFYRGVTNATFIGEVEKGSICNIRLR